MRERAAAQERGDLQVVSMLDRAIEQLRLELDGEADEPVPDGE